MGPTRVNRKLPDECFESGEEQIKGYGKVTQSTEIFSTKYGNNISEVGSPGKTIGHLFYATSSFVHHFVAIGEFKLELQSGNAQSGSNSTILRAVWPWNLTDDLEKQ